MRTEYIELPIVKNHPESRFEMIVDGYMAYIEYEIQNNIFVLTHTISPKEISGRGVATALIEKVLLLLKEDKSKFIPECPMIVGFVKKHPEWKNYIPTNQVQIFDEE